MTSRIFKAIFSVALAVLMACLVFILGILFDYYGNRITQELRNESAFIAQGIEQDGSRYLENLPGNSLRITWIDASGAVLFDNTVDPTTMANHADREEFQQAQASGSGESIRYSTTLSEKTVYYAQRLSDGSVLRVSNTQYTLLLILISLLQPILIIVVIAVALSVALASRLSKQIVKPINELDLEHPEQAEIYEELTPLLSKLYSQNRVIQQQMDKLRRKQEEFSTITENMQEGFLLLDRRTDILSYNTSALKLLGAQQDVQNQSALTLNRSESFRKAVSQALAGTACETPMQMESRHYTLIANPVYENGEVAGAVIVILDVTEKESQDQLRREFTANVSHELKTPLTSISGTAEMLKNGFVSPEDVPHFAANLYDEATRLVTLIDDILKLSQLDEGSVLAEKAPVDLYALCQTILEQLSDTAGKKQVHMELTGERATVSGVQQILYEMVYNLCDNAIKYNVDGGSVLLTVSQESDGVCLCVADTGIGIPLEDQARVFERFYRVDKSHSKQIGGTGLGLSIVKHGAAYHNADIRLDSQVGQGTTICIVFHSP